MILKHSKDAISKCFIEAWRMKTEGVKERIGAAALDRIKFRTLHQFLAKATSSRGRGHSKRSDVQPSGPNVPKQTAQDLAVFVPEKKGHRIPFSVAGDRNVMHVDDLLHNVVQIGSCIRVEYYGGVLQRMKLRQAVAGCQGRLSKQWLNSDRADFAQRHGI
jgi:hypothetical protein